MLLDSRPIIIYSVVMASRLTLRLLSRFCTKPVQGSSAHHIVEGSKESEVPVHLRPYDKSRYQVPMEKMKLNSGYAFLEVEPFPRAKIMKTCYHIMEQLNIGFPENSIFKIYNEEKTKYIMKIVDETTDVEELEDMFGVETIELFIDNLVGQLELINGARHYKIWEIENQEEFDESMMADVKPEDDPKYPAYRKPERPKASFIE